MNNLLDVLFSKNDSGKKEFLKRIIDNNEESTAKVYSAVMRKTIDDAERKNDRDWWDFSESMIDEAFRNIKATSKMTLMAYLSVIKEYLLAMSPKDEEYRVGYTYTLDLTIDDMEKYINRAVEKYRYITPDELDKIAFGEQGHPLSKALAILLYSGIKGASFADILELTISDINLNNGRVFKEGKVIGHVDVKYLPVIRDAINSDTFRYIDENRGEEVVSDFMKYEEYDKMGIPRYFLRRIYYDRRGDWTKQADRTVLAIRIKNLCSEIRNPYLDAQSIFNSGEAYRLLEFTDFEQPTNRQWNAYRDKTGSRISRMTAEIASKVLLNKLGKA